MAGFENDVVYAKNADFTSADNQSATESNGLATNGQLWIGSTSTNVGGTHINVGQITSPLGTLSVGYSSPNITIDLSGGSTGVDSFVVQTGTSPVVPTPTGQVTLNGAVVAAGTNPVRTDGTGVSTIAVEVQTSQALAAADATKIGLSNFYSGSFGVTATGFVTIVTGGMPWTEVTSATQTLAIQNGYITNRGGGVTYTLPATATQGDIIKIDGKAGLTTIAQNANQAIRMGSALSTTGAGGSVVGTNLGDCISLRCTTGGASTIWIAENWVGSWTVT